MDAVSYPNDDVKSFIRDNVIALKIKPDVQPIASDFNINWTPTLVTLDSDGREHHRTLGFLSPKELIASLTLGIGKTQFDLGKFEEAVATLDKLITEFPKSHAAPEALYYLGVTSFRNTQDPTHLKRAYERLAAEYKGNEWEMRAHPYSLIPG